MKNLSDRQKLWNIWKDMGCNPKTFHEGEGRERRIGIQVDTRKFFFNEADELVEVRDVH